MTTPDHLAKAKDYIARGEDYYRKAAQEIVAERAENDTSYSIIGKHVGRDKEWCRQLVIWHTSGDGVATPFAGRGTSPGAQAKRVARENPQALAEAIQAAPPQAQRKIADELIRGDTEDSLRDAVSPTKPKPRKRKDAEERLGDAVFALWHASDLLMDQAPEAEVAVRMSALAEKAARLAAGIVHVLDTGELDDEFRTLLDEVEVDV